MITVNVIYTWGTLGILKGELMWAVSKCKIRHGKVRRIK
jgi:hypothetical protein